MMNAFFGGAASVSLLVIAMFFVRFWTRTRDRLFLYFTAAFLVMMAERIVRVMIVGENEWAQQIYTARLMAFLLIILGIVDKNRRK